MPLLTIAHHLPAVAAVIAVPAVVLVAGITLDDAEVKATADALKKYNQRPGYEDAAGSVTVTPTPEVTNPISVAAIV